MQPGFIFRRRVRLTKEIDNEFDIHHITAVDHQVQPGIFQSEMLDVNSFPVRVQLPDPDLGQLRIDQRVPTLILQEEIPYLYPFEK